MNLLQTKIFLYAGIFCFLFMFSNTAYAQTMSFSTNYQIEIYEDMEPPQIPGFPEIEYPEAARKNGVEGTLKFSLTLAKDGTVKDIVVEQGLPNGVAEAMTNSLKNLSFQPARRNGVPVDAKMLFECHITAAYDQGDKNITKPKIIEKPEPVFPENQRGKFQKDKVYVSVLFKADGTLKVYDVSSSMPKDFDRAAIEAAKNIKFEPAVHKKSKNKITVKMTVEYEFKP